MNLEHMLSEISQAQNKCSILLLTRGIFSQVYQNEIEQWLLTVSDTGVEWELLSNG